MSTVGTLRQHATPCSACQIIRSSTATLVMSACRSQAHIYDLLAVKVLLTCEYEVKAIKVTSPSKTEQHLSSFFTPSVGWFYQTSLLPALTSLSLQTLVLPLIIEDKTIRTKNTFIQNAFYWYHKKHNKSTAPVRCLQCNTPHSYIHHSCNESYTNKKNKTMYHP